MPATSKKQMKFFEMLAHNPKIARQHDMSPQQASEYVSHNTGKLAYNRLPERSSRSSRTLNKMRKKKRDV